MNDDKFIPLLSGKPFAEFTPEEFKAHVVSLYHKREPRKAKKKEPKPFTYRLNKKGTLCIRVNRDPKWLLLSEIEAMCKETEAALDVTLLKVAKAKIEMRKE